MSSHPIVSLRPDNVIRQLPWQLDSKAALGFLLLLVTFSLVGWLYLTQASAVTTTSYRIDELRLELEAINNQNVALTLEIAELEALPRIEARARELGFRPTNDVRYLSVDNYPLQAGQEQPLYTSLPPAREQIAAYNVELETSSWWLSRLDKLAMWLEGR